MTQGVCWYTINLRIKQLVFRMNILSRFFWSALVSVLALFPLWMYLTARFLLEPKGFWQEFFLFGVGVWLLSSLQIIFLLIALVIIFLIWKAPKTS
mgnify:FL=1